MVSFFFIALLLIVLVSIVVYSLRYGITPTPTSLTVQQSIKCILPHLPENSIILDLGSGWGNLVLFLHRCYPECQIYGYEISPLPYLVSKLWVGHPKIKLFRKDFFETEIRSADLVVCYLYPAAMERLKTKFKSELRPGTYVLTHTFSLMGWTPIKTVYSDDLYKTSIYLYQI